MNIRLAMHGDAHEQTSAEVDSGSDTATQRPSLSGPIMPAWYCVGESGSFKPGQLRAVRICGEQIVVLRREDGALRALRDRCPHRGMALSKGTLDGDAITCPFHGWQFTSEGRCRSIPALSTSERIDVARIHVRSFDIQERQGLVWINPVGSDPDGPAIPGVDFEPAGPPLTVAIEVEASFDLSVLSLVDPAHVTYVHDSWWWRTSKKTREKVKRFEPSPYGFTMRNHQAGKAALAYRLLGGVPDVEIEFRLPGVRLERISAGRRKFANYTFVTPISERRSMLTNVMYWNVPLLNVARPAVRPLVRQFLDQDRRVLEIAQQGLDRQPSMILLGECDLPGQWYFGLKREFIRASRAGERFFNPLAAQELRWRT